MLISLSQTISMRIVLTVAIIIIVIGILYILYIHIQFVLNNYILLNSGFHCYNYRKFYLFYLLLFSVF